MSFDNSILEYVENHMDEYIEMLRDLVELESPSHENKEVSDKCCDYLEDKFSRLGFSIERIYQEKCGDHLYGEMGTGEKSAIFVGHYDTVFPIGTIEKMPFFVEEEKAYGPGILDMKGGIVMAYMAVKTLIEKNQKPDKKIGFFFNSDEESGSFFSREWILEKSEGYQAVLVMEPGINDIGSIKVKRYGRGTYTISATGIAAHSGSNPHLAVSPILELSRQLERIQQWDEEMDGVTFAPVYIHGGVEGTCMIPEKAWFTMDVRYQTEDRAKEVHEMIMGLTPIDSQVILEVDGKIDKPVMVGDQKLIEKLTKVAKRFSLNLNEVTVGGGSDGNFTSHEGIPTLDGLGTTGEYLHNSKEYIHLSHVPVRIAMIATFLTTL